MTIKGGGRVQDCGFSVAEEEADAEKTPDAAVEEAGDMIAEAGADGDGSPHVEELSGGDEEALIKEAEDDSLTGAVTGSGVTATQAADAGSGATATQAADAGSGAMGTQAADAGSGAMAVKTATEAAFCAEAQAVFDGNPCPTRYGERTRNEDREAELSKRVERYAARAVLSEARAAAALMGVPADRLDDVAKLCELSGIDPEEDSARAKIAGAVRGALGRMTGLTGGAGTGSAVATQRPRRDAFERGFLGA